MIAMLLVAAVAFIQLRAHLRERDAESAYPPQGRFIEVEGTRIHARVMGEGPDLVLLHGASGSMRDMDFRFAQSLAEDYRVILFDRPGLGWSGRPPGYGGAFNTRSESPALQARLLQQAADRLGAGAPIVLGHSYGGAVALAWALERPDRTAALVIVSGVSNPWPGGLGRYYEICRSLAGSALAVPLLTALVPKSVIAKSVAGIFAPQPVPEGYLAHFGPGMTLRRESLRANAQQVGNLLGEIISMSRRYGTLSMPVEIVHGTADDTVPLDIHSEKLARQIPGANVVRLDGIGHMPHHSAPDAVRDAIARAARRSYLR
ncbi:alpha/beta hydrolase [Sulfitobacter sp. LCG007]